MDPESVNGAVHTTHRAVSFEKCRRRMVTMSTCEGRMSGEDDESSIGPQ